MQHGSVSAYRIEAAQYQINAEHQDVHGTAAAAAQFRAMAADAEQRAAMADTQEEN